MNPWNEPAIKRRLAEQGYTPDEIEDALDSLASDAYDRDRDYEMEDQHKEKANENK